MLILCSFISYATEIINEPFDYSDDYANHGWSFSATHGFFPTSPLLSPFASNAFGLSAHNPFGGSGAGGIYQSFSGINNGIVTINYDFWLGNNSVNGLQPIRTEFYINGTSSNSRLYIDLNPIGTGMNLTIDYFKNPTVTTLCGQKISNQQINITGTISVVIDIDNNLISAYINSTPICSGVDSNPSTSNYNISKASLFVQYDGNEYIEAYIDNFVLTSAGLNTSLAYDGEPCTSSDSCASGYCEYGQCVLKITGYPCTSSSQCMSNDCHNGLCTKPSLWEMISQSKKENFGSDSNTNNFLSIFIMIAVPAVIIIASGGASIGILISLAIFYVLGFFFAIVGWLSPFILIGMVVVSLIIMVFAFMIKGHTS